jgi:hypothetical protein
MDVEMKSILKDKNLSDQDKWIHYEQVLQKYMSGVREMRKPIKININNDDNDLDSSDLEDFNMSTSTCSIRYTIGYTGQ